MENEKGQTHTFYACKDGQYAKAGSYKKIGQCSPTTESRAEQGGAMIVPGQ